MDYMVIYDPTIFVAQVGRMRSIDTIFVAILLVVGVVFLFLQTWRASIIPVIAIPVSLIGTFAVLVRSRHIAQQSVAVRPGAGGGHRGRRRDRRGGECRAQSSRAGMSPTEAAHQTMDEVGGALVSIALTLCAVFVPSAFLSGISGQFFRQFAVTIAASTVISCFVSLTLSPALCAVLFKAHDQRDHARAGLARSTAAGRLSAASTAASTGCPTGYGTLTRRLVRAPPWCW